jgi:hypothetical protein
MFGNVDALPCLSVYTVLFNLDFMMHRAMYNCSSIVLMVLKHEETEVGVPM